MIYLDNAATSFPKPRAVIESMALCMTEYCANPGRAGHKMALKAASHIYEAREKIAEFFNIKDPFNLSFTSNATMGLNYAIKGSVRKGDHVITSSMEHNSVMRPLHKLKNDGLISLTVIIADDYGDINPDDVRRAIKPNTRLIAMNHSSNVTGTVIPAEEIGKIAKEAGVMFLLDASQTAGTVKIDVEKMNIDLMALPGHKSLMGPQGTGILFVRDGSKVSTLIEGGTGSKSEDLVQPEMMPDKFESGTPNTPGIIGLMSGIDYINEIGLENIYDHKMRLRKFFIEELEKNPAVIVYSKKDGVNTAVVSINIGEFDSSEVTHILDKEYDIATRSGIHCAPIAHKTIGTFERGTVRFSFSYFTTVDDINAALNAVNEISRMK
jgi:cysteine desulfurase / selenocysteine lyase